MEQKKEYGSLTASESAAVTQTLNPVLSPPATTTSSSSLQFPQNLKLAHLQALYNSTRASAKDHYLMPKPWPNGHVTDFGIHVFLDHCDEVQTLLESKANTVNDNIFLEAAKVPQGTAIPAQSQQQQPPYMNALAFAILSGCHWRMIKLLLGNVSSNSDTINGTLKPPLTGTMKLATIHQVDSILSLPVVAAFVKRNYRLFGWLIEQGAVINVADPSCPYFPMEIVGNPRRQGARCNVHAVNEILMRQPGMISFSPIRILNECSKPVALPWICWAVVNADMELLRTIIFSEKKSLVNEVDEIGCTALHRAAMLGLYEYAEALLIAGIDQNKTNNAGFPAIKYVPTTEVANFVALFRMYEEQQIQ